MVCLTTVHAGKGQADERGQGVSPRFCNLVKFTTNCMMPFCADARLNSPPLRPQPTRTFGLQLQLYDVLDTRAPFGCLKP